MKANLSWALGIVEGNIHELITLVQHIHSIEENPNKQKYLERILQLLYVCARIILEKQYHSDPSPLIALHIYFAVYDEDPEGVLFSKKEYKPTSYVIPTKPSERTRWFQYYGSTHANFHKWIRSPHSIQQAILFIITDITVKNLKLNEQSLEFISLILHAASILGRYISDPPLDPAEWGTVVTLLNTALTQYDIEIIPPD